jgi:hypothetical protein
MAVPDRFTRRRVFGPMAFVFLLTAAVSIGIALSPTTARGVDQPGAPTTVAGGRFEVPPLPVGSAQVRIQPGMSKKDWNDAYKETGRPKFNQSTVKRAGGTIERD